MRHLEDLDMPVAGFDGPELTASTRLEELDLVVSGQSLTAVQALLAYRLVIADPWCRGYGARVTSRGSVFVTCAVRAPAITPLSRPRR